MNFTTLCYIEKENKYLMLHRTSKKKDGNKDKWIGVGGHFEKGESPEECLLREVKEETGLELTSYQFRGIVTFISDEWPDEYMCLYTADGDLLMGMDGTSGVEDFSLCGEEDALQQVRLPSAYDMEVFVSIGKEFERQGWLYPNCMLNKQILFSQIHLPKKEDIGKRALALYALAWFSKLCLEDDKEQRQQFEEFKQRFSLEHCLTSQEASLLKKDTLDKQQAVELLSKFECANMLFWCLGYDGGSSWDVCDVEKMKEWIMQYASFEDFLNHCAIKDEKDIYTQYVRVFYAEHFYMQSAMLYVPLSLQEDVVSERLRACKWLCDGCE